MGRPRGKTSGAGGKGNPPPPPKATPKAPPKTDAPSRPGKLPGKGQPPQIPVKATPKAKATQEPPENVVVGEEKVDTAPPHLEAETTNREPDEGQGMFPTTYVPSKLRDPNAPPPPPPWELQDSERPKKPVPVELKNAVLRGIQEALQKEREDLRANF